MIEVYYAEDDEIIGKSVKEYLEKHNCKVTLCESIADTRKALLNHLPSFYWTGICRMVMEANCAAGFGKDGKLSLLSI